MKIVAWTIVAIVALIWMVLSDNPYQPQMHSAQEDFALDQQARAADLAAAQADLLREQEAYWRMKRLNEEANQ